MKYFVGIDIGGTTTTIAIGDSEHNITWVSDQFSTDASKGPLPLIVAIANNLASALASQGISIADVASVGLSTPGPATIDGTLLNSPNLKHPDWNNFSIRGGLHTALLAAGFTSEVFYIGDGQAAAYGEFQVRSGRWRWPEAHIAEPELGLRSMFMVIVGTGLGGGEVRDGKVVRGAMGRAGHAGHIFLPPAAFRYEHDTQLVVGNSKSTVESAVSLTGLTHQLFHRLNLPQWSGHTLHQHPGSIRDKAKSLRDLANGGDTLALELFDDQARALGVGLLGLNYIGDYDLLIVGGGVCDLSPTMRDRYINGVRKSYHEFALDGFRNFDGISYSACGDTAPVIGAVAFAKSSFEV